jgi:hypothetical protein
MSLTPNEAADALRDIEKTGRRSGEAVGYRYAAPHFILWGLVWVAGYGGTDFFPRDAGMIWLGAIVLGAIASALVRRTGAGAGKSAWQTVGLVIIVALFIAATYLVMWPVGPKQQAAFPPLLAGAAYSGMGLFAGVRWIVAGAAIAALTVAGFFLIREHYALFMAAVGGGGLVLAGLWMRSA